MTQNDRTPAGKDEGSGKMSGLAADIFQLAPAPRETQTARILSRFAFSSALAATVADLAFGNSNGSRA